MKKTLVSRALLTLGTVLMCAACSRFSETPSPENSLASFPKLQRTSTQPFLSYGRLTVWDDLLLLSKSVPAQNFGDTAAITLRPLQTLWQQRTDTDPQSQPVVMGDLMAVGGKGNVQLLRKDGTLIRRWNFGGSDDAISPFSFPKQIILTPARLAFTIGQQLFVYDLNAQGVPNQDPAWTFTFPEERSDALTMDSSGNLYAGWGRSTISNLISFNPDGSKRWEILDTNTHPTNASVVYVPIRLTLQGNHLISLSSGGAIHKLDLDGNVIWKNKDSCSIDVAAVTNEGIYQNCVTGSKVIAYDLTTGKTRWTFTPPEGQRYTFGGTPLVHNGVVYAANGRTWALDAQTGEVLAVSPETDAFAVTTNPVYYPPTGEIVVAGNRIDTFKPVR
jgi:hypothetical protein